MTSTAETFGAWPALAPAEAVHADAHGHGYDYRLAQRAAGGDASAFEEIYTAHSGRVYSLCLRMTRNPAEAEDLTQDVFIHLFNKIGGFRGASTLRTWLHRLTVNQVLMHFRRNKSRADHTSDGGEAAEQVANAAERPGRMPVVDRIALEDALDKLPPGYRAVFILHDIEGYEHEEIAEMLGCAAGTSKSQLHKARMKLRRLLRARPAPASRAPRPA